MVWIEGLHLTASQRAELPETDYIEVMSFYKALAEYRELHST